MKNLAAVVVLLLAVGGGFAGYHWYLNHTGEMEQFRLVYQQPVKNGTIRTVMLGRVSERAGWQAAADQQASDLARSCAGCQILEKTRLDTLSARQKSLLKQKRMAFHYISLNTSSRNNADIRLFYPAMGDAYTAQACETGARKIKASMNQGEVRCIEASG
jgi:hypothetical protein